MLCDSYNRIQNYLRVSLTGNCNFRCGYCMPKGTRSCLPGNRLMTPDEIEKITKEFVKLGVEKIRLTGGEPLVRKDFGEISERLAKFPVELTLTTNGALIHQYINLFQTVGIASINVSLDSLNPEVFFQITKRNLFHRVWNNIMLLLEHGIHVKINVVAIRGIIEDEIFQFAELTRQLPLHIRFIEFMPFKGNNWSSHNVVTAQQMLDWIKQEYDIVKLKDAPHATAKKYKIIGFEGTLAFITTMSNQFCGDCNRLRITADGKLKNCLFGKQEVDLLEALRTQQPLYPLITQSVQNKFAAMGGQFKQGYEYTLAENIFNRSMVSIGG